MAAEELSWYPSWSNSLWKGGSCGLVHCLGGNATEPIWRVMASSLGISSRVLLKTQHSNPNPSFNPLANQLWCIDFLTPPIPLVIMTFFPSLKQNFIAYRSSKVSSRPDCIFEIHQQWKSGFSRMYSNSCCSYSFKSEIIKIRQSSYKLGSNNILNFQESTKILDTCTKSLETYWRHHVSCKPWNREDRQTERWIE